MSKVQASQTTAETLEKMPLAFTKNMGQWDERVLFRASAGGATMWFTKEGVTYQFIRRIDRDTNAFFSYSREGRDPSSVGRTFLSDPGHAVNPLLPGDRYERDSVEQMILTAKFLGANPNPEIIGEGQMEYKCNYFLGNDPAKWHTDVPNYQAITLKDIYPGIDLRYSGEGNGQAAYEFIAAPGADIAQIKVAYEGAEETSLDDDGRMIVRTRWGDMIAAIKTPTDAVLSGIGSFSQLSEKTVGFEANESSGQALGTLAVGLVYSTYLGGYYGDQGYGIAVDGNGNAYVTGRTYSPNFPTQNAYDASYNGNTNYIGDAFVTKLSSSGNSLIYSTYLGGSDDDCGYGIAVDGSGNAYVTGSASSNFPTLNPYQTGGGVFVTKLSSSGNTLVYSTCLNNGSGYGIAIDGSGNAYVTGTASSGFPTLNPYQTYQGPSGYSDVFVTKLSSSGNTLVYSTYLGGGSYDWGYGIAVDGSGNAYVTGRTSSSNFPIQNPFQGTYGGGSGSPYGDAFVTNLSSSGNSLIYSTYLGGGSNDEAYGIAVDGGGNAYVTGHTESSNFPVQNPYQAMSHGFDVFVTKLSSTGNSLIYSTYLGWGRGYAIAVDGSGYAYVTGYAGSGFPTLNPYQMYQGSNDAFVTKLSSTGNSLIYSTYLGGGGEDYGQGITVGGSGNAYVTGRTNSSDFPILNPYQTYQANGDVFVTKLTFGGVVTPHILLQPLSLAFSAAQGGSLPNSQTFALSNTGGGTLNWAVSDNASWLDVSPVAGNSNSQTVTVSVNTTNLTNATYNATITVSSSNADNSPQTISVQYEVYQPMSIVSGQVFDKFTNGMLNGVTVELWQSGLLKYSAVTNSIGEYGFGTIPSGTYEIRINHPGYYAFTRTDDIVELTEMLAPIFLYDTSHYVSTESLRTAFEAFRAAFYSYFASDCDRVSATLELQFGKLLTDPEFSVGRSLATQLANRLPFPDAAVLQQIVNGHDVFTKRNAGNAATFLIGLIRNTWLDYQKADLNSYFASGMPPGNSIYSKKAIVMPERVPSVYSMTDLLDRLSFPLGSSLPDYVVTTYPMSEIVSDLNTIKSRLDAFEAAPLLSPLQRQVVYERLPGSCDIDALLTLPLGDLGQNHKSFRNQYASVLASEKRERSVAALCDVGGGTNTLAGMTTDIGEDLSFFAWVVVQGCQTGVFLSDVINAAAAGDLAINFMNYSGYWPEKLAQLYRVYDAFKQSIKHSVQFPSDLNCSQSISLVGAPSTPDACVPSGEDYAVATGQYTFKNNDPAKTGKVRIEGKVIRVRSFFGKEWRSEGGYFKSATYTLSAGETATIPVQYPVLSANLSPYSEYFEIVPNFVTSAENGPGPTTTAHDACLAPQWFEQTTQAVGGVIHQGQEIIQGIPNHAGALWNKVKMRFGGSDIDLHLYDGVGGHLGRNYSTGQIENTIPNAVLLGDSTNEESIHYQVDPARSYQVKVVGVDLPDSESVYVDVTTFFSVPASAVVSPDLFAGFGQQGDTITATVRVRDLSGQNQIHVTNVTVSDLISAGLDPILSSSIQLNHDGIAPVDSSSTVAVVIHPSPAISVGVYTGTAAIHTDAGDFNLPVSVTVYAPPLCGDANADAAVDISDAVSLIAYIFSGGSAPNPLLAGDANCDSMVDISDVVYLIAYIFSGGAAPCAVCK